jgi:PIN domain nuclease of toxin-antitoxin system
MKRLLLDTHVLIWWLANDMELGPEAKAMIAEPRNVIAVSAASTWEISIKRALGKLVVPENMDAIVEDEGFIKLPISLFHGEQAGSLPAYHRDPFDRMLIAQAQAEGLEIVTGDARFAQYGIKCIDAGK